MDFDIASKLQDWDYSPNDLNVRKIKGIDGKPKIQVRMDLGLLQMEWEGRPDGLRPNQKDSQLEYFRSKLRDSEIKNGPGSFSLTRDDCWLLAQEAMKFYWRRISFFELKINNLNGIKNQLWDTQKNIEEDVKLAQKKEGLEEEIRKDKLS